MSRLTLFLALFLTLFLALSTAQAKTFIRGSKGFSRDRSRLASIPQIQDLSDVQNSGSPLGRRLISGRAVPWRPWAEGTRSFQVELGNGTSIQGTVYRYRFPMTSGTKLTELSAVKGSRRVSLMPESRIPVLVQAPQTAFFYDKNHVLWHGPESRLAVLAYFHELGHAQDFSSMSEAQRLELRTIYDRKCEGRKLTPDQLRTMVGFERSAWAHGLRQVRQLRQQGIDLFGGIGLKEIMHTVYGSMKGYYEYRGTRD